MQKQLAQLKELHTAFDGEWSDVVSVPDKSIRDLRITLMQEELSEVVEAMKNEPIENIAKELTDLLVVVFGTIGSYGLSEKIEKIFDEVHKSNMSKLGDNGKPVLREDGKFLKGPNYTLPDIKSILN